ncbi:MAG: hypothetical protein M1827_007696 [Pycnora praestabilis]|nr:MAG: hypothetical protein M1827_007696 [Pycnora praestabilis]
MAKSKVKKQPSHYPFLPFHLVRSAQLLSSLIVAAIMFYFIGQLKYDHFKIPWTFLLLLGVSLLTNIALTLTIVLYCCRALKPAFNVILNIALAVLWGLGFALLAWNMSGTLTHQCNTTNWGDESGVMVCRCYKALFTFALVGLVSTLSALVLDVVVRKRTTARGKYNVMEDIKLHDHGIVDPQTDDRPFEVAYPYSMRQPAPVSKAGYAVPEQQETYDTGYHSGYNH